MQRAWVTFVALAVALVALATVAAAATPSAPGWLTHLMSGRGLHARSNDEYCEVASDEDVEKCERSFVTTQPDLCAYVQESCSAESNLNFMQWHYCSMYNVEWLSYIIQIAMIVFIFIWLGMSAEDFFVPQMEAIVQTLRLSQNVAGVTFLALANSAPDLVGSVLAINQGKANLAVSQLVGAGTFVTTVVVGIISLIAPFKLTRRPFLRDVLIYLTMVIYMLFMVLDGQIVLAESIVLICVYVTYVLIVVFGRIIHLRMKSMSESVAGESKRLNTWDPFRSSSQTAVNASDVIAEEQQALLKPYAHQEWEPDVPQPFEESEETKSLLQLLLPIVYDWEEATWMKRVYMIIAAPVLFALAITVPVVDVHRTDLRWNKWLFMINMMCMPMWAITATALVQVPIGTEYLPAWVVAISLGIVLMTAVFVTTKTTQAPLAFRYAFILGFVMAALWLYTICGELIGLLQSLGRLMNLSDVILGLTVLAWGNSIGDLVSNPSLARKGYPGIGVSAAFAGPLLNLVMGLGVGFTSKLVTCGAAYPLQITPAIWTAFAGLLTSLTFSLCFIVFNGFQGSRVYGIILIVFYLLFLSTNITIEFIIV
eukprot:Unigene10527_Nuclearia_a/m.32186 Unigene10527_Nuclearia_a/g.32186  ORF Unigene10527_Nuclearia_a/g.32186 Unigene10527_Nuclearia_a/m.32186 type:complete len:596 (+) Unigene10527_Nuclearia_a:44-1831(+)